MVLTHITANHYNGRLKGGMCGLTKDLSNFRKILWINPTQPTEQTDPKKDLLWIFLAIDSLGIYICIHMYSKAETAEK